MSGAVLLSENDVAHFKLAERDEKRVVIETEEHDYFPGDAGFAAQGK